MLKTIKNKLFKKFIRSKPYTDSRDRKISSWTEIKSIAFLVDGKDPIELRTLLNRIYKLEDEGKKVSFLGYVKKTPPFLNEPIKWITNKDLNWIGIPKMSNIKSFIEKDFDVLINTTNKNIRPLEFVSTYSKANLRIGLFDEKKTYCYDFMIRQLPGETTDDYLNQVELYLRMMKG